MELKIKQAIELGETLIKHYKYAIKLYTKGGSIRLNQDYLLFPTQNDNLFFNTIEKSFNDLTQDKRQIIGEMYFKNQTACAITRKLFISRSTVYRLRDKALIKIANDYAQIFK